MGLLLTTRLPRHRISWVLALAGLWWGVGVFSSAYAVEALVGDPGSLPWGIASAWLDSWMWLPGIALFLCALLVLMPDGRLSSRRSWPVPAAVVAGTTLATLLPATDARFDVAGTQIANPLASDSPLIELAGIAGGLLAVAGLVAALVNFVLRYRRSEGDAKQQLRWVVISFAAAVVLGVFGALMWGVVPGATLLPALALVALPAGIAVAVLKYRLYELDLVVNRAAVYFLLTVAVIAAYVLAVGLVGSYLSRRGDLVVSLVVTGIVAIGFQPLRERVQRFVNRLMYGERDDPYFATAELGRTLARSLRVDAVLPTAVETIGRTLALQYVGVRDSGQADIAVFGTPATDVLVFPLIHHGASIGELRLAPRPGERLRPRDERLIDDLAPQVAAAVHSVALSRELESARRRMVRLREEERRRIRRDLHDGLGPALAGLTFTLDAVRNLAESDLERADELLASATGQVRSMIGDVRRLIYGLRPPALDELGLVASLHGLSREVANRTRVEIAAPDVLPPLEAAVEVATYRIVQEALTNVARHARARTCLVRLSLEPRVLALEVRDDGRGFSERGIGVGLQAMRERAVELGGSCEIRSTPRQGTTVSVRLPREDVVVA
jgi:signal transduction histidine kinase